MSKQLKIAMVTGIFPIISETFIVNQIQSLLDLKQRVEVFCLKKGKYFESTLSHDFENEIIEFQWLNLMPPNKTVRFLKVLEILFKALKNKLFSRMWHSLFNKAKAFNTYNFFKSYYQYYFEIEGYDVLHIHFGNNAMLMLEQIKNFKGRVVVTFHGFDAHKFDALFYKPLKELSRVIYTVNTEYARGKVMQLGFKEDKIKILPVGLDTQFFNPSGKREEGSKFNIVFIGRLVELKAPLLAIQIVHELNKSFKNIVLHIVGSGTEEENCKSYVKKNNLEQAVVFHGNKTQQEIKELMNNSDLFLFPGIIDNEGRCEAQGLVIQEAQAMELPVIISDVGGMKEGIVEGITGCVIKANDINDFVDQIKFLIKNPSKLKNMGKAGREFVVKYYDNSILAKQLLDLYLN